MKSEIPHHIHPVVALTAAWQLPSSRRGARQARHATARQLTSWGWQPGTDLFERAILVVAELAANAVTHGHVRGRDFQVHLLLGPCPGLIANQLRIEVSDARGERLPRLPLLPPQPGEAESGRGLLLVEALADAWGTVPRPPSGKTLWAELADEGPRPPGSAVLRPRPQDCGMTCSPSPCGSSKLAT
ncbi:ATP-binding protein [Kitasatospora sp. NPDC058965]|uniref:ATP-binding protein n=1 Tax=Kitasatospora sp. NPDC058965 TaxID=3346682 RepID=UPI0036CF9604